MGLWDKVNPEIGEQVRKKKELMAKKMAEFKKRNPDVGQSGQRHSFDYSVHKK